MINCILKPNLPEEHAVAETKDVRYKGTYMNCPLFNGRQICLWCCLHICDIGEPLKRGDSGIAHPEFEANIPALSGRNWDEIWQTCSQCSTK